MNAAHDQPHPPDSPHPPDGSMDAAEDETPPGIFRSWRSLYVTVVVYTVALTLVLYVLTRLLDFSA